MSRDVQSLQELSYQLQHMKAALRQASDAFIMASTPDVRSDADLKLKLSALGALIAALGTSMDTLVEAITMHKGLAADDAPIR